MTDSFYRQEVFNVILAQLLQERGLITLPESIINMGLGGAKRMPDVMVNFNGLRTVLEGEIDKSHDCRQRALESARKRVEEAIAHIGIAIIYPKRLRPIDFNSLKIELSKSKLEIAIVTEAGSTGFVEGDLDYLTHALKNTFSQLIQEDVVVRAVAVLDAGIGQFAKTLVTQKGSIDRVLHVMGIGELETSEPNKRAEED